MSVFLSRWSVTFRIGSIDKNDYTQTDAPGEAISEISTSFL
jgi:hypothetical protein